jgi:hypothetical protein
MLSDIWSSLLDENNRTVLAWIGGGVVVVVGGVWAVVKFMVSDRKPKSTTGPSITATNGGVAAGRDIRGSKIETSGRTRR